MSNVVVVRASHGPREVLACPPRVTPERGKGRTPPRGPLPGDDERRARTCFAGAVSGWQKPTSDPPRGEAAVEVSADPGDGPVPSYSLAPRASLRMKAARHMPRPAGIPAHESRAPPPVTFPLPAEHTAEQGEGPTLLRAAPRETSLAGGTSDASRKRGTRLERREIGRPTRNRRWA